MNPKVTVVEALAAVMEDVQAIRKGDRNDQQNFNFRGVDAVVNAVGPALRRHGVIVVPTGAVYDQERYTTSRGAQMRGVTANVCYRFYGPAGDYIDAGVLGEASDAGDKAIPKAFSVAYRTLLLQTLCVPTDEPDPDAQSHDRVSTAEPVASRRAPSNGSAGASREREAGSERPAETPAGNINEPLKPEDVIVHFGKNRGTRLGDLTSNQLDWYASTWEPTGSDAHDDTLKAAAALLAGLKTEPQPVGAVADDTDGIPF